MSNMQRKSEGEKRRIKDKWLRIVGRGKNSIIV